MLAKLTEVIVFLNELFKALVKLLIDDTIAAAVGGSLLTSKREED